MAFDKTTTLNNLQIKADNAEEIKLGDFIANYSHNNSDYTHDELMERIVKYYTQLHDDDFLFFIGIVRLSASYLKKMKEKYLLMTY